MRPHCISTTSRPSPSVAWRTIGSVSHTELNSMVETLFNRELLRCVNKCLAYIDTDYLECRPLRSAKARDTTPVPQPRSRTRDFLPSPMRSKYRSCIRTKVGSLPRYRSAVAAVHAAAPGVGETIWPGDGLVLSGYRSVKAATFESPDSIAREVVATDVDAWLSRNALRL